MSYCVRVSTPCSLYTISAWICSNSRFSLATLFLAKLTSDFSKSGSYFVLPTLELEFTEKGTKDRKVVYIFQREISEKQGSLCWHLQLVLDDFHPLRVSFKCSYSSFASCSLCSLTENISLLAWKIYLYIHVSYILNYLIQKSRN